MSKILRLVLAAIMLLVVGAQTGCDGWTQADTDFVKDLAKDWLREKNMSPTDEKGKVDWLGAVRFGQALIGRSDDEDANAVLGAYGAVSGVIGADKAMDEARASGDAAAMDKVIAIRPNDWTYHVTRSVLAVVQGDDARVTAEDETANRLAADRHVSDAQFARQIIRDYEAIVPNPETHVQCYAIYSDLADQYAVLADATGEQRYFDLAGAAEASMDACP
jgi:hypothetical protein